MIEMVTTLVVRRSGRVVAFKECFYCAVKLGFLLPPARCIVAVGVHLFYTGVPLTVTHWLALICHICGGKTVGAISALSLLGHWPRSQRDRWNVLAKKQQTTHTNTLETFATVNAIDWTY